ncbi:hypothetical protein [Paraburkholderia rhizosphaerae]|uniref:hypothetical protein n=1 Tax=Paraburkholderia rhizosphaerae TaxID=480658 RepID=UPI001064EB7C|nr:hypothetical protein [Paraburkholderia rhizosphaerae]
MVAKSEGTATGRGDLRYASGELSSDHWGMMPLLRFFIVLSLSLLAMQGARAHTHVADALRAVSVCAPARACDKGGDAGPRAVLGASAGGGRYAAHHHGCSCCATGCGLHCGALIETFRFSAALRQANGVSRPHAARRYDGIKRAPPVRPPIALV